MYQYVYKEKFISIVTSNICNLQKQKMYEVKTYLPGNINLWIECDYSFFFVAQRRKPSPFSVRLDFLECAIYVLYSCQRKRLPLPNDETGTTNFNVLKCIVIANTTVFSPYVRGKNFSPPILVYKGLHTMFHDIPLTAQRNFSKFEGVGSKKRPQKVLLAILIANNAVFSP